MKAFILKKYGGAESTEFADVTVPVMASNDIKIEVSAIGLNPVDFKTREGKLKLILKLDLPIILGNELTGVVTECGKEVSQFNVGDTVMARVEKARLGAFAEYVCVDASVAALIPETLPANDAAALPLAGLTALQALRDELGAAPGKHILITGGAGGVGTLAIQIAKRLGATVTTTASPRGAGLVHEMGADHIIDYTMTDLSTIDTRFDGVFDLIGGETLMSVFQLAKPGSTVVSVAGVPELVTASKDLQRGGILKIIFWIISIRLRRAAAKHNVRYRFLFMSPSGKDLTQLNQWVDAGELKPIIDKRFTFDQMSEAMAYLEAGRAKGKVIVEMRAV